MNIIKIIISLIVETLICGLSLAPSKNKQIWPWIDLKGKEKYCYIYNFFFFFFKYGFLHCFSRACLIYILCYLSWSFLIVC